MRLVKSLYMIILVLTSAAIWGCNSDYFTIPDSKGSSDSSTSTFDCHIITLYGTSDRTAKNGFTVYPGGIVSVRKFRQTEFNAEFYIKITNGDSAHIRIRSEDLGTSVSPGILLTYGKDGSYIDEPGKRRRGLSVRAIDDWQRVQILSYAKRVRVIIGCDTVLDEKSNLMLTDCLVFESAGENEYMIAKIKSYIID